jgi:hypothetical protein
VARRRLLRHDVLLEEALTVIPEVAKGDYPGSMAAAASD